MAPFRCGRRRPRKPGSLELKVIIASLRNTGSTPCWARSTSTTRATSPSKTWYGMSGAAASTCRWSKAWQELAEATRRVRSSRGAPNERERRVFPHAGGSTWSARDPDRGDHFGRGLALVGGSRSPDRRGRPDDGKDAWFGEQMERGAELAVADLNSAGGVLGQQVQLITADDSCDPEQAVAAARKLVARAWPSSSALLLRRLDPGIGNLRGGGVLLISPASSNPMLTELGRANVFRVQTRDDAVGIVAGNYLADHGPTRTSRSSTTTRPSARASPS